MKLLMKNEEDKWVEFAKGNPADLSTKGLGDTLVLPSLENWRFLNCHLLAL